MTLGDANLAGNVLRARRPAASKIRRANRFIFHAFAFKQECFHQLGRYILSLEDLPDGTVPGVLVEYRKLQI